MQKLLMILAVLALGAGVAQAETILVDLGNSGTDPNGLNLDTPDAGWNNIGAAGTITNAVDTTDTPTAVDVATVNFMGYKDIYDDISGLPSSYGWPMSAQRDSCYQRYLYTPPAQASITLSGLTEAEYTLHFWAATAADDVWYMIRTTEYVVGGVSKTQNSWGAGDQRANFYDVAPDPNGNIVIDVNVGALTPHPSGNGDFGYGYVGVMEIIVPEPATMSLLALGGLAVLRRRR